MKRITFLFLLCAISLGAVSVHAQNPLAPTAAPAATSAPTDSLGRASPKGMLQGFLKAVGNEDYAQASAYLDLRGVPGARQKNLGPELAKGLQTLLDQGGSLEPDSRISDSPEGNLNDGMDPKQDIIGTIRTVGKTVPLVAERHDDPEVGAIWQVSKDTVAGIPALMEEMATGPLDRLLPSILIEYKVYGVPAGHWLAIFTIAVTALFVAWMLTRGVLWLIRRIWTSSRTGHARHVLEAFAFPLRLYIALGIFVMLARTSGISIVARQNFTLIAEIAAWLSLWWLLWRIIDIITETVQERMTREMRRSALSSVVFFRRSSRFVLAIVASALAMTRMGMDVTGWFTALGIGGLALAFGAQKTLENFVVGLTLILDQSLRIGDFCRIADIKGTVEDIGMRSTRLKTQEGTIVSIPNGMLATQMVENFALRTRFWFHHTLGLRYDTSRAQLRQVLEKLTEFLNSHYLVEKETAYARFIALGKDSLSIEIFAFVFVNSGDDFLKEQQEMLLRVMEIVEEAGAGLAFPSQTVYMARDKAPQGTT